MDELRTLIARQHADGQISHITYWEPQAILENINIRNGTSNLIQPPILAYALWRIYEATGDKTVLAELYPAVQKFYSYILRERDVRGVGLYGLVNPDESGEDNAPRFDAAQLLPPQHDARQNTENRHQLIATHASCHDNAQCTSQHFWVEDLAFNTYLYWNLTILSDIAYQLQHHKDSHKWARSAQTLKTAMRNKMFQNGTFHTLTGLQGIPTSDESWTQFLPLLAGLYTQSEAHRLVHHVLLDTDRFWVAHGIPTVAPTDPAYQPAEPAWGEAWQHPHWRGPIWMVPHWCIYHGLLRYGFTKPAEVIKQKSHSLIERNGFREYFHPESGVGMGAHDFTWGGLVLDMQ